MQLLPYMALIKCSCEWPRFVFCHDGQINHDGFFMNGMFLNSLAEKLYGVDGSDWNIWNIVILFFYMV